MVEDDETPAIGFWSAFIWLVLMTGVVALLSEYVVATIEVSSIIFKEIENLFFK